MSATPITLPAVFTPNDDTEPGSGLGHLSAWCPHCERLHYHGAAGRGAEPRIETRGAHCDPVRGSPLAGRSYGLQVIGSIAVPAVPDGPMPQLGHRLQVILRDRGMDLRRSLFHAVVCHGAEAIHYAPGDIAGFTIGKVELLTAEYGRTWQICEAGGVREGQGLFSLLAMLFSISPGIAARRIIEAMAGTQFLPDGALEIEALLDRLAGAGERQR